MSINLRNATLVRIGELSVIDAFQVGVTIENTDIANLREGLKITTRRDIKNLYMKLIAASQKHLADFNSHLGN